jgi:phage gp46-like protein
MLKLIQTDWGKFDLQPDDGSAESAVATLVYAVLFTDQEAPANRADAWDRRGWYKNPQAGSGLWHLRRQPLDEAARREAVERVQMALQAKSGALFGLEVESVKIEGGGNVSEVLLEIAGTHNGREFLVKVPLSDA